MKTGRNDLCPCGSGNKFKKCCESDLAWTPFVEAVKPDVEEIREKARLFTQHSGITVEVERLIQREANAKVYVNNLYQVNRYDDHPEVVWLSIKRRDKAPIHDWRHLQKIKNELVGPENEAVEIYPAESRLVDTANQYHLWVFKDPTYRFPLGFNERLVTDSETAAMLGAKQRSR